MTAPQRQILTGLRVLDLTHVIAGPHAAYHLAILGADVVKIENPNDPDVARSFGPGAEDDRGRLFRAQGVGKRAVALDLTDAEDREAFERLLETADVLVENYRTGALEALGYGAETLLSAHPRLIVCSVTGFGQTGPRAGENAYDNVIQATSGLMSLNGAPDVWPLKIGAPIVDYATGLAAAHAVMAALYDRERTGRGQHVDVSMFETALGLASVQALAIDESGRDIGPPHPADDGAPQLGCYATRDGRLMIGAMNRRQFERLMTLVGRPHAACAYDELAFQDVAKAVRLMLEAHFATAAAEVWADRLNAAGVPAQRVRTLGEALADPHLAARGGLIPTGPGEGRIPLAGYRFSDARIGAARPALGLDQDRDALRPAPKAAQEQTYALSG